MRILYADTSALVRAYFADEPGHAELRDLLLDRRSATVTSELARVELAGAVRAAERARRLPRSHGLFERIEKDCSAEGSVSLARFEPESLLTAARELVIAHRLRTMDAFHLATAFLLGLVTGEVVTFVTRDQDQAFAAAALGFVVR